MGAEIYLAVFAFGMVVLCGVNAKSLSCLSSTIPFGSLYPATNTLALHPMSPTPVDDGTVPATSACPTGATSNDPLNRRSTCPYEYVDNYDVNRIPAKIQEARCLCTGCIDPFNGDEDTLVSCEPIMYPMKVLRNKKSCIQDFMEYELTIENIAVGCACPQFL